jgi:hypothetical protein
LAQAFLSVTQAAQVVILAQAFLSVTQAAQVVILAQAFLSVTQVAPPFLLAVLEALRPVQVIHREVHQVAGLFLLAAP